MRIIRDSGELARFQDGEVLVAAMTDPDWEPVLKRAAAVVTDHAGRTCHAALVSRELGIPCVVGTADGTRLLRTGDVVTVSCAEGEEGRVYAGSLPYERMAVDPSSLPKPRVPVMLNVGDPELAFSVGQPHAFQCSSSCNQRAGCSEQERMLLTSSQCESFALLGRAPRRSARRGADVGGCLWGKGGRPDGSATHE